MTSELFTTSPLLEDRLGKKTFSELPSTPGIYRFYDRSGELLYVGKAKNLRTRLFSYKRARAGSVSRKVSKLIGRIAAFEIEETESEQSALLLENQWIRDKRPPFNHANKQTEAYYFIYFKPEAASLEFRLSMRIHDETDEHDWFGSFKSHAVVRRSLGCLLQLLWMAEHGTQSPSHLPVQLTRRLTPMRYLLFMNPTSQLKNWDAAELIGHFFHGYSCELLDFLTVQIETGCWMSPFQTRFMEDRLHHLKTFYDRKLIPYHRMRGERQIISQHELDDLFVKQRF